MPYDPVSNLLLYDHHVFRQSTLLTTPNKTMPCTNRMIYTVKFNKLTYLGGGATATAGAGFGIGAQPYPNSKNPSTAAASYNLGGGGGYVANAGMSSGDRLG